MDNIAEFVVTCIEVIAWWEGMFIYKLDLHDLFLLMIFYICRWIIAIKTSCSTSHSDLIVMFLMGVMASFKSHQ